MAIAQHTTNHDEAGMIWWNQAPAWLRRYWLDLAGTARPVDAWHARESHRNADSEAWRYAQAEADRIGEG